jgi:hypothetical protein
MTTSVVEPATFWLVVQCLNQLRHRMAQLWSKNENKYEHILCKWKKRQNKMNKET